MFLGKTIADRARNQKRQWWDKKAKWSDKKWRSMNKDSAHRIFFQKHHTSFTGFSQLPRSRKGKCDLYPGKRFRHEIASVAKGAINVSKVATVNFTSNSTKKEILLNYVLDHLSNTGCPKKSDFQNAAGATVHRLNQWWPQTAQTRLCYFSGLLLFCHWTHKCFFAFAVKIDIKDR